jgi:hypothetical protein
MSQQLVSIPRSQQKTSKLAITSLICGVLGGIELILMILSIKFPGLYLRVLSHSFYAHFIIWGFWGISPLGFSPGFLLIIVLSIIFGIIATVKIRNNPNLKGTALSAYGACIGTIMLLIYLYILFAYKIIR